MVEGLFDKLRVRGLETVLSILGTIGRLWGVMLAWPHGLPEIFYLVVFHSACCELLALADLSC